MKKWCSRSIVTAIGAVALLGAVAKSSAATYSVDPGATWLGYMNVFDVGAPGYGSAGAGGYVFGSGWGTADLSATFAGPVLSLAPNTIGDPDPFWYTPAGGPGATGNKIMDASIYQQFDGSLAGTTVTFTGDVLGNTLANGPLDAAGHGWTTVAFIKDFAPDFSSFVLSSVALPVGVFSVSLATINDPARHVQFGFETIGPDVWITDVAPYGSATITAVPVPEPAILALAGMGGMAMLTLYRRRTSK